MLRVSSLALIAAALAALATAPAFAQDSTVIVGGPANSSSVTVDMSVLDALGPEPNVPDMMQSGGSRSFVPSTALGRRTLPVAPEADLEPSPRTGGVSLHKPRTGAPRAAAPRATAQKKRAKPASQQTARATPAPSRAASAPSVRPPPAAPAPPPATGPVVSPPAIAPPPAAPAPPATASAAPTPQPAPAPAPTRSEPEMTSPAGPIPATSAAREPPGPAAAPPPAPAPAAVPPRAAPPSPPAQTAAIPPPSAAPPSVKPSGQTSLAFAGQEATLSDAAKRELDGIAARAAKDESLRLQLMAYASGTGEAANSARRLSLSRALAVRSYLIDKGVRSTRIDVRALGNRLEGGGEPDRVDVVVGAK